MPLDRPQKILAAMLQLSEGTTKALRYEEIVVAAFEKFPEEFALRGFPQYPDSSDIHKPLYGPLKRAGFVRNSNKSFALTERGIEHAKALTSAAGAAQKPAGMSTARLSRSEEQDISRLTESAAFKLFAQGRAEDILDSDFFAMVGCTVRTPNNDFVGRFNNVEASVRSAAALGRPSPEIAQALTGLWAEVTTRFAEQIKRRFPQRN